MIIIDKCGGTHSRRNPIKEIQLLGKNITTTSVSGPCFFIVVPGMMTDIS
jgi:hypothetical protein